MTMTKRMAALAAALAVAAAGFIAGAPSASAEDEATQTYSGPGEPVAPLDADGNPISGWFPVEPTDADGAMARAAAVTGCVYGWSTDYATEEWNAINETRAGVEVYVRNCDGKGATRWAQPLRFNILCRSYDPGSRAPGPMMHNLFFSDRKGNSYNPHSKKVPCNNPDWQVVRHKVPTTVDRFRRCDGGPPKFTDDYKVDYPTPWGSDIGVLSATFWVFTGPHTWNC